MPGPKQLSSPRVVHKSTGGTLNAIPEPVDPVGNAPSPSLNTVAHPNPCASGTSRPRARELRKGREKQKPELFSLSVILSGSCWSRRISAKRCSFPARPGVLSASLERKKGENRFAEIPPLRRLRSGLHRSSPLDK